MESTVLARATAAAIEKIQRESTANELAPKRASHDEVRFPAGQGFERRSGTRGVANDEWTRPGAGGDAYQRATMEPPSARRTRSSEREELQNGESGSPSPTSRGRNITWVIKPSPSSMSVGAHDIRIATDRGAPIWVRSC